ncbi:spinster family MFS transporter [Novosphingobium piscinae]|uniref:MFS transporter n=1 Tax=Novosphingobium piscinae TaxID=1507448 RepID=A0A7X1G1N2_9SPHN|nr:MFS transporter [Novosphingobium piscinae]MBC2670312.1 MFS transporter [Novosphingobium piscinae]
MQRSGTEAASGSRVPATASGTGGAASAPAFSSAYRRWLLLLILLASAFGYIDRVIIQTLGQAIKEDLRLTDFQLGILGGLSFALLYSTLGLPIARLAERANRLRIIAVSIGVFSGMALLCGTAMSFAQLFLYRIGVGIGEAGVQAPSVSLLGDHFPAHRRGMALGIMKLGSPVGSVTGAVAGGWIAHAYGWRAALIAMAAPGLVLALLYLLTLREPPRGLSDDAGAPATDEPLPPFSQVMRLMLARAEFRHLLIGLALATMGLYSAGAFVTAFFIRVHGLTLAQAGLYFGVLSGISATTGMLVGGYAIDAIARRGPQWYGLFPALGLVIAAPLYLAGYSVADARLSLALQTLAGAFLLFHNVPTLVAFQNMVGLRMRASAAFVFFFVSTLVGIGFGPTLLGWLSDSFAARAFGAGDFAQSCPGGKAVLADLAGRCRQASAIGVRHALMAAVALMLWSAIHYAMAARRMTMAADNPTGKA